MMLYGALLFDAFGPLGYLFEIELTQVIVSLSKSHDTPPNVEEG